jgi:uncharacterized protein (TIGR02679 family)
VTAEGTEGARARPIPADLLAWASRPGPAAVLAQARERIERGHRGPGVTVSGLSLPAADRVELGRVLGLEWQGSGRPVRLGPLRRALARAGVELERLLERDGGPLRDRPAERALDQRTRAVAEDRLRATLLGEGVAEAVADVAIAERWLGPAVQASEIAADVVAVLRRLPAPPGTLLAELASEVLGDPHALDRNRRLGRVVLRLHVTSRARLTEVARVGEPAEWRAAWAAVGVTCDRVSSLVLVLNLPLPLVDGDRTGSSVARLCAAAPGEPVWLTARSVPAGWALPKRSMTGTTVRVCENPSVIEAAADRLSARARPLVCTFGQVSVTCLTLLQALSSAGADLLVSGDRDAPGLVITAGILRQVPGARPWLPDVPGLYEEDRLTALVADLAG